MFACPASELVHTNASFISDYGKTAFVNNIENNRRLTFAQYAQATTIQVGNSEPPRTYGIRLGGHF